jgi:hypothetical protein
MTRRTGWAFLFLAVALAAAAPSRAQQDIPSADTSKPISIKTAKPPKPVSFVGAVISSNAQTITVRSNSNLNVIRTFTFAPAIQAKMQQIAHQGGFPYGVTVTVKAEPGSNVALRVKGKT